MYIRFWHWKNQLISILDHSINGIKSWIIFCQRGSILERSCGHICRSQYIVFWFFFFWIFHKIFWFFCLFHFWSHATILVCHVILTIACYNVTSWPLHVTIALACHMILTIAYCICTFACITCTWMSCELDYSILMHAQIKIFALWRLCSYDHYYRP